MRLWEPDTCLSMPKKPQAGPAHAACMCRVCLLAGHAGACLHADAKYSFWLGCCKGPGQAQLTASHRTYGTRAHDEHLNLRRLSTERVSNLPAWPCYLLLLYSRCSYMQLHVW